MLLAGKCIPHGHGNNPRNPPYALGIEPVILMKFQLLKMRSRRGLEQPNITEDEDDGAEKGKPRLPADACPFGHEQHPVHGAAQPYPGRVERVVHLLR